jgi:transcriptional regulator with XRE-family HTH domain
MTDEPRVSAYEDRASTPEGRISLAAARLALRISDLLHSAKIRSGHSSKQIADQLGITEGRVSQILNGSGNLHVATVARFLAACGFELSVKTVPLGTKPSSPQREKRNPAQGHPRKSWHIFAQDYISSSGVIRRLDAVRSDVEHPIPVGEPVHMGSLVPRRTRDAFEVADEVSTWQERTQNALDHEGTPVQKVPAS